MPNFFDDTQSVQPNFFADTQAADYKPAASAGRGLSGYAADTGLDLAKGAVSLGESVVGLGDLATGGLIGKGLAAIGYDPKQTQSFLSGMQSDARQQSDREVQNAKGFWDTAIAIGIHPDVLIGNIVQSMPGTISSGAVAGKLVAKLAGTALAEAGTLGLTGEKATEFVSQKVAQQATKIAWYAGASEGAQASGSIAEAARQDGKDWHQYVLPAIAAGLGDAAIVMVSGAAGKRLGLGDIETDVAARTAGVKGAGIGSRGALTRVPLEAIKEGVLEEAPQSYQEQVMQNLATGRPATEGAAEAAAQGMAVGAGMGGAHSAVSGSHAAPQTQIEQPAAPGEAAAQPLQLPYNPDPFIAFPDGSVGRRAEVDAYLAGLPTEQQIPARARLLGLGEQPVEKATVTDITGAKTLDEAIAAASTYINEPNAITEELKNKQIDSAFADHVRSTRQQEWEAALQARREADIPAMQAEAADQQVAQANALTTAQGFGEAQPTALQLVMEQAAARKKLITTPVSQRAALTEEAANVGQPATPVSVQSGNDANTSRAVSANEPSVQQTGSATNVQPAEAGASRTEEVSKVVGAGVPSTGTRVDKQPALKNEVSPKETTANVPERAKISEETKTTASTQAAPADSKEVKDLIDFGYSREDALKMAGQGEPATSVQNNASGESAASMEAVNRLSSEKEAGRDRVKLNTRTGEVTPLVTADRVDATAGEHEVVLQKGVGKETWTVLDQGDKVGNPKGAIARATAEGKLASGEAAVKPAAGKAVATYTSRVTNADGTYRQGSGMSEPNAKQFARELNKKEPSLSHVVEERPNGMFNVIARKTTVKYSKTNAAVIGEQQAVPNMPEYGKRQHDAVSVVGVHFSNQPRAALSSTAYGRGMKGAESERLAEPANAGIRQRIAFYVDTGNGVHPESGVGGAKHVVQLNNLYDATADHAKLWNRSLHGSERLNDFEKAVAAAGYAGYYSPNFGKQGAAVLLGSHEVRVAPGSSVKSMNTESTAQPTKKTLVNIGMDKPEGGRLALREVWAALDKMGVSVMSHSVQQSATEPTVVAQLSRPLTPEEAYAVSEALHQEAIAQRVGDNGELYGPKAEQWRPFNSDYFLDLKGQPATEKVFPSKSASSNGSAEPTDTKALLNSALKQYGKGFVDRLLATNKFQIIDSAQAADIIGNEPEGPAFFDPKSGISYLISDKLENATSAQLHGLVLHEVANHALQMGRDSVGFKQLLDRLELMAKAGNKEARAAFASADQAGASHEMRSEEALGYLLEANPTMSLAQRVVAWFRATVRSFFKQGDNLRASDIVYAAQQVLKGAPAQLAKKTSATSTAEPAYSKSVIVGDNDRARTPEQLAAFAHVGRTVTKPSIKERMAALYQDAGKKLAQGLVDQFAPIKDISYNAYTLMRLSKGSAGAFEVLLKGGQLKLDHGVYNFDTSKKGGVVDRLLTPLQGEGDDFLWWVAGNRAEQLSKEDRENLFRPSDIAAFKTLDKGTTKFDYTIQNGARAGQVTKDRSLIYADALKTFNEFHKNTLDMAAQSGLIDQASRQYWEQEFYVPFYRVNEDVGLQGANIKSGVVRQQAFKKLKGGGDKLNGDLLDNTLMNWAHLLDAAAKNRAAQASLEAAAKLGVAIEAPEDTARQMAKAMGKRNNIVWFMDEGKQRHFIVDDPYVLTALQGLEFVGLRGPLMDAMGAMKHALTVGVTASPFFKVRNLIRDSLQAIGTSDLSYNVGKNLKEGFAKTNPKSDEYFTLLAGGGTIHFGTMLEGSESKRVRALVEAGLDDSTILNDEGKLKKFYKRLIEPALDAYQELGNRGEAINRAALYDQLTKKGMNHAQASLLARDLMDFSMGGAWTSVRFLTQVVPFLNARLQGLYKLGRAAGEDPKKFAVVLGTTALSSIALMLAYSKDADWKKREDWDRDNFWWFKIGGEAFRIPKPFEIGAIASLAERGVELFSSDEMTGKRFRSRLYALLSDNLAMNPVPQLVKPILDVYANTDSFTGRPIETLGMEKLQPDYRYTGQTSMAARGIATAGNAATGDHFASPVQVDHMIRGYFSWLGTFIVGASDIVARPVTGQPGGATPDFWKMATGGMVADAESPASRYVSQLYSQAQEIEQAYGTFNMLRKEGRIEEARTFAAQNAADLRRYKLTEEAKRLESRLNERIRMIERSAKSPDEKRALIRDIQRKKDAVAHEVSGR